MVTPSVPLSTGGVDTQTHFQQPVVTPSVPLSTGGVDTQTHFQQPVAGTVSCDDFYSGTRAALAGGTTTVLDVVMPERGESLVDAHGRWAEWAEQKACCDYGLHVGVTWWSEKVPGVCRPGREMAGLTRAEKDTRGGPAGTRDGTTERAGKGTRGRSAETRDGGTGEDWKRYQGWAGWDARWHDWRGLEKVTGVGRLGREMAQPTRGGKVPEAVCRDAS